MKTFSSITQQASGLFDFLQSPRRFGVYQAGTDAIREEA